MQKRQPYRNKKILKSARGEDCTMNSPACNYNSETVVACHLNEGFAGKGMGQKADDCAVFFGCSGCHDLYDGRIAPASVDDYAEWYAAKDVYVLRAYYRTIRRLLDKGALRG